MNINPSVATIQKAVFSGTNIGLEDSFIYFTEDIRDNLGPSVMGYSARGVGQNKKKVEHLVSGEEINSWHFEQLTMNRSDFDFYRIVSTIIEISGLKEGYTNLRDDLIDKLAGFFNIHYIVTTELLILFCRQIAQQHHISLKVMLPAICCNSEIVFDFTSDEEKSVNKVYYDMTDNGKSMVISRYDAKEDNVELLAIIRIARPTDNIAIYDTSFISGKEAIDEVCKFLIHDVNTNNSTIILKNQAHVYDKSLSELLSPLSILYLDGLIILHPSNIDIKTFIYNQDMRYLKHEHNVITSLEDFSWRIYTDDFDKDTITIINQEVISSHVKLAMESMIQPLLEKGYNIILV